MGGLAGEFAVLAKHGAVAVLVLLVLSPCLAILWKGTNVRRALWRLGCWRWVICCDRIYGEGVSRADLVATGGHGAQTVLAYYQLMFDDRPPRSSSALQLRSWRNNVRDHSITELTTRLEEIKIVDEQMHRQEPLVLPDHVPSNEQATVKQQGDVGGYASLQPADSRFEATQRTDTEYQYLQHEAIYSKA